MTLHFAPPEPHHVPKDLIFDFDFFHMPHGITDPAEIWHDLRRRGVPPIFYTPRNGGHWVFLDYADIVEAYRDHGIFSTYQTPIPPIEPFPVVQPQGVDPPEHQIFRRLLAPMFTPIAVRDMADALRGRAALLIEDIARQKSCDLIEDFASRFPTATFLHLFGLPEARLEEFLRLANTFFRSTDPEERALNLSDIYQVLDGLFHEKMTRPGSDIASAIVSARDREGNSYAWQDILNCGFLLFVAGLDTVTNTMAYIWRYLAMTPSARHYFLENIDNQQAFSRGVEELLRINAVSNLFRRIAKDTHWRGVEFRRNDRIILPNTLANRDAKIFENPNEIDLNRAVNVHVTFGVGPHRCIGSHLAKTEIIVSLQEWLKRIPDFELDPARPPAGLFGGSVMGFTQLGLRWPSIQ